MQKWVLVVDDNEDEIQIMKIILQGNAPGLEVKTAAHGEAALEMLKTDRDLPALILLDLKMPRMSGIDVLRRIRADVRMHDIPVAILTHSSMESEKEEGYKAGANHFIRKSFDIKQFTVDIKNILELQIGK